MPKDLKSELQKYKNPRKAQILQRFFKTGKGEYGEGDIFLGITVPIQRQIAKKFSVLKLRELQVLLKSKIHEERLIALLILIEKYKKAEDKQKIFNFYLKNTKYINNWDLVDLSSHKILGAYLEGKDKTILKKLAKSQSLWERRISVISTFHFIQSGEVDETLKIIKLLLNDKHDLIHKACGWALREVGKKNLKKEVEFLKKYKNQMPRTMLRYAIEKFDPEARKLYLSPS